MKVLGFFVVLMLLVSGVFAEEWCYEGKKDNAYNELLSRGYTLKELTTSCKNVIVNSESRVEINPDVYSEISKLIYVNTPPSTPCTSGANFELVKLGPGMLRIDRYSFTEEFNELDAYVPDKEIMNPIGYYNNESVVYSKYDFPFYEYYAFDITKSGKLMDVLFPRINGTAPPANNSITPSTGVSDEGAPQNKDFLNSLLLAAFFGFLLNLPLCVIIFASGSLEDENKDVVKQFLVGRALGLFAIGLLFVWISSLFLSYNYLLNIGFGVMCVGLAYTTYSRKEFCKKAFSYTGGFIRGFMPCAKLTPVLPLLIGMSLLQGAMVMLVFVISSTIYFFIIFYLGRKIILKLAGRTNKMITVAIFLILGLYFIYRGIEVIV